MKIVPLKKDLETKWNEYILSKEDSDIYHTLEWKEIITEVYGYEPHYILALDDTGTVKGILPLFHIKSFIFGEKICSNPFSYHSTILCDNPEVERELIKHSIEIFKERRVRLLELKPVKKLDDSTISGLNIVEKQDYLITDLKLSDNQEEVLNNYDKKLKKNLRTLSRNAENNGIELLFSKSEEDLKKFYDIFIRMYRDKHEMLCQPYIFFLNMHKNLNHKDMMQLLIAKKDNDVLAGMVLLLFNKTAIYFCGASNPEYNRFSLPTLLVDKAIRWCSLKKSYIFSFGLSSRSKEGLIYFKERWGSHTYPLFMYYYSKEDTKIRENIDFENSYKFIRKIYKRVPLPLIKFFLPRIIKQLG